MGADAVKLLAQFEPTEPQSAEHQFQLIDHVYSECKKHDILMLLETVAFPFGGEKKTDRQLPEPKGRRRSSSRPASSAGSATSTRRSFPARWAMTRTTSFATTSTR